MQKQQGWGKKPWALGSSAFCLGTPANYMTSLSLGIFSSKPRSVPDDPSQFKGSGISFGLLTSLCPLQVEGWAKCTLSTKLEEQTRGSALNHGEASSATYYLYVFGQNPSLNSFETFFGGDVNEYYGMPDTTRPGP